MDWLSSSASSSVATKSVIFSGVVSGEFGASGANESSKFADQALVIIEEAALFTIAAMNHLVGSETLRCVVAMIAPALLSLKLGASGCPVSVVWFTLRHVREDRA
jgi:hypothetical protein